MFQDKTSGTGAESQIYKRMRLCVRVDNNGDLKNVNNIIDIFLSVVIIGLFNNKV